MGTMGYIKAMKYFNTFVIAVAALAEPVIAELIAACVGVSLFPGLLGWLGNTLVAGGTLAVIGTSVASENCPQHRTSHPHKKFLLDKQESG